MTVVEGGDGQEGRTVPKPGKVEEDDEDGYQSGGDGVESTPDSSGDQGEQREESKSPETQDSESTQDTESTQDSGVELSAQSSTDSPSPPSTAPTPTTPHTPSSHTPRTSSRQRRRATCEARLKRLKEIVDKAAQPKGRSPPQPPAAQVAAPAQTSPKLAPPNHKTFTIFGKFPSIRDALKARGWVQNFDFQKLTLPRQRQFDDDVSLSARLQSKQEDMEDIQVIARLLRDTPVHFIWAMGENIDWNSLSKSTIISRFPRVYFTTKVGLCSYLEQAHWFWETGVSLARFPRCYNLSTADDMAAFVKDFRLSSCLGLLQTLIAAIDAVRIDYFSENGKVPLKAVEFAVKRVSEFVASQEHEDIDMDIEEKLWNHQWDQFLTYYYQIVHERSKFLSATDIQIKSIYHASKVALDSIRPYWPHLDMDGVNNLWIVKPAAKSRGRGINVFNKLEDVVSKIGALHPNDPRFVVQKYIERPLLIYNTKFDIRQWFLVTSAYPLTIWMYKESYLRFCSQLFSLTDMHESVHLSNNAIQCKYKNAKRDKALPDENMWDCYTFQTFLRAQGWGDKWDSVIYPGMRESITGTLLAAQEHMEHRVNCFELYGADFILTEDLTPWLIEINSSPCMAPTTSVTARMCAQCLEDVIKVVIDRRYKKDADTGMFELVYKQQVSTPQPYMGTNLTVKGSRIALNQLATDLRWSGSGGKGEGEGVDPLAPLGPPPQSSPSSPSSPHPSDPPSHRRVKKRVYKRHSCLNHGSLATDPDKQEGLRQFTQLNRQLKLNCLNRLDLPQSSELLDWRQRVKQTRASCERMVSNLDVIRERDIRKVEHAKKTLEELLQSAHKGRLPRMAGPTVPDLDPFKSPFLKTIQCPSPRELRLLSNLPEIRLSTDLNNNELRPPPSPAPAPKSPSPRSPNIFHAIADIYSARILK